MKMRRSNVGRWYHEQIDSTGDAIADIVSALKKLNPAAEMFVELYLGQWLKPDE